MECLSTYAEEVEMRRAAKGEKVKVRATDMTRVRGGVAVRTGIRAGTMKQKVVESAVDAASKDAGK